ncbi:hypothetical protein M404DRAFT_727022 [Pisolithus tinctorius Marx 270]|uniref:Uncharacterized protein n=1 Tax=Pisolithus tinctorius Marx 270 TaxID=870435 RepID=A0A0C3P225_PISTI|nr:hypothetical protein M404DRAFT_727022 [Pisolithus tinctorius Marx 270]
MWERHNCEDSEYLRKLAASVLSCMTNHGHQLAGPLMTLEKCNIVVEILPSYVYGFAIHYVGL